ncbi:conserved Plasmodium protein, unknown function [Plasmodium knowlesi strain H]|uniref:Uncharacterized protein n=3 Tax=Plasmodium knowlesi TaxID=5850 RepID=A0A5K1UWE6_PLAKH|nr:conserved Plasmodium protein, unknown function [Plasmodium knowlesi strain H]OTN65367.1 Uncharacterized protein PKNOH_S110106000 [Plasmodium knowlesi]CAA9989679.1 conserved Plasmodium protein, unknown function [Plasmodium knowlesi strain H]SBO22817.1 conserved Plasmodium protein, unknown function [Plasmodium knowlesi strain H]SBO23085.1 conserved Plasmodium protein, unknown function [Plasmodium knowlesi strain H]VVS79153.1 conserved Plasmodium protein, unknown function [Plasmodium knowlesi |eukprot:XP_002260403.1 hypothetical protein, conserved in Plasmodium species [Plasmodium knowlesi strain H]
MKFPMALKTTKKKIITKEKYHQNDRTKKRNRDQNVVSQEEEDQLSFNPFKTKEQIKPFELSVENEITTHEEEMKTDSFKDLLKRRIKQMNQKMKEKDQKVTTHFRHKYQEDIENSGKNWFENKLLNDVPRKLTTC